jgi:hypothetical protein
MAAAVVIAAWESLSASGSGSDIVYHRTLHELAGSVFVSLGASDSAGGTEGLLFFPDKETTHQTSGLFQPDRRSPLD